MKQTAAPDLQPVAFATNGTKDAITSTTDTGSNNASYDVGFPDITMLLKSAGGLPPKGGNFNQILYELSSAAQYLSTGAGYAYDSTFSTGISGYPLGAVVRSSDMSGFWLNLTDENTVNPENSDGTATGWTPIPVRGTTAVTGLASTSVTLTSLQAAKPIITLAGVLTANIQVILPPWTYAWDVTNNCTGSYTVTVKTTSGTGVVIPASSSVKVVGDSTNINYETTSRFLPGVPSAPTAAAGTSTTQIASTAFVTAAILAATGKLKSIITVTEGKTVSIPSTTTGVLGIAIGAGGGGAGARATSSGYVAGGGGGGAGGVAVGYTTSPPSSYAVTIGTPGSAGSNTALGGRGGTTTIPGLAAATGGEGGQGTGSSEYQSGVLSQNVGGAGGSGTLGSVFVGTGGFGNVMQLYGSTSNVAGDGGSSWISAGGRGASGSTGNGGSAASNSGAGGGGAVSQDSPSTYYSGGTGGSGIAILFLFE